MAVEYISRKDVLDILYYVHPVDIVYAIKAIRPADVVEQKHGVWLTGLVKDSSGSVRKTFSFCSLCNMSSDEETRFCPYCGAQMESEG